SEAKAKLKSAKLKTKSETEFSSKVEDGKVISQSIKAGKSVTKNKTVKLTVSKGPKPNTDASLSFYLNYGEDDFSTNKKKVEKLKPFYLHFISRNVEGGKMLRLDRKIITPLGFSTVDPFVDTDGNDILMGDGYRAWLYWPNGLSAGEYTVKILERETQGVIGSVTFTVE
ncbi:MAG: PASTA domain-containing protein, partial [Eubacterium sp.]|nr:PASTA domain-containing protein [Eubacterium sp.]